MRNWTQPHALFYGLVLAGFALPGCNTIKGLIGGGAAEEQAEPVPGALASAAAALANDTASVGGAAADPGAPGGGAGGQPSENIAANQALVKRFEDEQKLAEPESERVLLEDQVQVLTEPVAELAPTKEQVVAELKRATPVAKHSERSGFTLITFENAENPTEQLMGWVKADVVGTREQLAGAGGAGAEPVPAEPVPTATPTPPPAVKPPVKKPPPAVKPPPVTKPPPPKPVEPVKPPPKTDPPPADTTPKKKKKKKKKGEEP